MLPNLIAILLFLSSPASTDDVLEYMARLPATETGDSQGYIRWDRVGHAREIAEAIATVAPSRIVAAEMTVYAVYEGGNRLCAKGDHGMSRGPFQLWGVPEKIACDPVQAARRWLVIADASRADCAKLEADAQLAELASGSCDRGRVLARRRAKLARDVAEPFGGE
jgi:hypothetical protein